MQDIIYKSFFFFFFYRKPVFWEQNINNEKYTSINRNRYWQIHWGYFYTNVNMTLEASLSLTPNGQITSHCAHLIHIYVSMHQKLEKIHCMFTRQQKVKISPSEKWKCKSCFHYIGYLFMASFDSLGDR